MTYQGIDTAACITATLGKAFTSEEAAALRV